MWYQLRDSLFAPADAWQAMPMIACNCDAAKMPCKRIGEQETLCTEGSHADLNMCPVAQMLLLGSRPRPQNRRQLKS